MGINEPDWKGQKLTEVRNYPSDWKRQENAPIRRNEHSLWKQRTSWKIYEYEK